MKDKSPECIARNVIRALEHPNLDENVKNAREMVVKEFTYETAVRTYKDLLDELMKEKYYTARIYKKWVGENEKKCLRKKRC